MKVYNTLTREKEELQPIKDGTVTMYSCGPTVYNYAHIGNLRTYIFMDELRRALKFAGYKIKGVMNITDVGHLLSDGDDGEDKMEKAAKEQKKTPREIADFYTEIFFKDLQRLNIGKPEIIAKATDHINDMIKYVQTLCDKGYGYETSDGIYFDISKFDGYGKLSRLNLEEQIAGARVEVNTEKRHPADFALWKKAEKNHIMQWQSPWGMGYPGWHIECSAMSRKYLGATFDIHTGGVDHIPVHHENEIAQSEACEGHKTVNVWMHGEFMLVDGGKMSKSLGNTYTIDQLIERGYSPLAFRYFCLNAHYRKKLNFTFEGMDSAQVSYNRLLEALYKHKIAAPADSSEQIKLDTYKNTDSLNKTQLDTYKNSALSEQTKLDSYKKQFAEAINDDLNFPLALGILWTMVKEKPSKVIYDTALEFDKVLGLDLKSAHPPQKDDEPVPAEVEALAKSRLNARKEKNWAESDRLRDEISALGYTIADSKDGYTITKK